MVSYMKGGSSATPLSKSAATLKAGTPQVLQSTQQTVGVVVQTLSVLNFGVQEFAGVDRQADGVVGVTVRVGAEVSKAGTFVSTVADVGGSECSVLFGGPAGRLSRAGVESNLGLFGEQSSTFLPLRNCSGPHGPGCTDRTFPHRTGSLRRKRERQRQQRSG